MTPFPVPVRRPIRAVAAVAAVAVVACGGKNSTPTEPSGPPVQTTTITITASGVSPKNVQVSVGAVVTFINSDTRPHYMASDPHPEHNLCLELDPIGLLQPNQRGTTTNLVQPKTCGFHDHDLPNVVNLQGSITIR